MNETPMQVLGRLVRARREHLGLGQGDLADFGGPKVSTVGKIERAAQDNYPPRTHRQLEQSLGWGVGTVRRILAVTSEPWWGDAAMRDDFTAELVEAPQRHATPASTRAARDVSDDQLGAEVTYRLRRYADELRATREREGSGHRAATTNQARGSRADLDALRDEVLAAFERYRTRADEAWQGKGTASVKAARLADVRDVFVTQITAAFARERPGTSENVG